MQRRAMEQQNLSKWVQGKWRFDEDEGRWYIPFIYSHEDDSRTRGYLTLLMEAGYMYQGHDIREETKTLAQVWGAKYDSDGEKMPLIGESWVLTEAGAQWIIKNF